MKTIEINENLLRTTGNPAAYKMANLCSQDFIRGTRAGVLLGLEVELREYVENLSPFAFRWNFTPLNLFTHHIITP
jgi:hypothetical protein